MGLNFTPVGQYAVPVSGKVAEKLLTHKAWWTPLADGKTVLYWLAMYAYSHPIPMG